MEHCEGLVEAGKRFRAADYFVLKYFFAFCICDSKKLSLSHILHINNFKFMVCLRISRGGPFDEDYKVSL